LHTDIICSNIINLDFNEPPLGGWGLILNETYHLPMVYISGLLFDTFVKNNPFVRLFFFILILIISAADLAGQADSLKHRNDSLPDRFYLLQKVEREGQTMPEVEIKEVTIVGGPRTATRKRDYRRYERLIFNIKKVYPYAIVVRKRLEIVNKELKSMEKEKERKAYLRTVEKDVFSEYEDEIAHLTITQGKILLKLIDRETQNTSYELIRDYRGKISAAFWQGIARLFGTNLKTEYDRYGDDAVIEMILMEIEAGRL
jgi:hypothetical protein